MLLPEVFRYAAEFGSGKDSAQINTGESCFWVSFTVDNEIIGMTSFYRKTGIAVEFHPYILHKNKDLYNGMVQEIFKWFVGSMPESYIKINAVIPVVHKGAINAAIEAGMTQEGVDRMSYKTQSGACDRINYGITREEMGQ